MPFLRAYIDETGDRGHSAKSSPFFAFSCVIVADEDEPRLRAAVSQLRRDFKTPAGTALHWNKHVRSFARRRHASQVLGQVPNIKVMYVGVEKAAIPVGAGIRNDHALFYNYASALCVERILLEAGGWPGGERDVVIRFGHVRGFKHQTTEQYLRLRAHRKDPGWVPWHLINWPIYFSQQDQWDGLQAADQYAGMLWHALTPDEFGNYEAHHLLTVRNQIRTYRGKMWTYGFKWLGNEPTLTNLPWWPHLGCPTR